MSAFVTGVGVACAAGFDWRALHAASPAGGEPRVPSIPAELDVGDARLHRVMSRPARLMAIAARRAIGEAGWTAPLDDVAWYAGVGFLPVPREEIEALLARSWDGGLSHERLGRSGLRAFHPLRTFLLLPNFTMCHGALLEGTRGPNGAFFSRGGGTVVALGEALRALDEGCTRALAGGADSPLDPFEHSDHRRRGEFEEGLVLGEGAAVMALSSHAAGAHARVASWALRSARRDGLAAAAAKACEVAVRAAGPDLLVLGAWGKPARAALDSVARAFPRAELLDANAGLGETFAAGPALAWATALSALRAGQGTRALVLSAGVDEQVGAVMLEAVS
jgi:3-oxoacyl-(acyl-carrier-protein) synthase